MQGSFQTGRLQPTPCEGRLQLSYGHGHDRLLSERHLLSKRHARSAALFNDAVTCRRYLVELRERLPSAPIACISCELRQNTCHIWRNG